MTKTAKNTKAFAQKVDRNKFYSLAEALKIIKDCAKVRKFDETVEISLNLGVDPKHADQQVRGMVSLPNGTGASVRVAVFARDAKAEEARKAGEEPKGGSSKGVVIINVPARPFLRPAFKKFSQGSQARFLARVAALSGLGGQ